MDTGDGQDIPEPETMDFITCNEQYKEQKDYLEPPIPQVTLRGIQVCTAGFLHKQFIIFIIILLIIIIVYENSVDAYLMHSGYSHPSVLFFLPPTTINLFSSLQVPILPSQLLI